MSITEVMISFSALLFRVGRVTFFHGFHFQLRLFAELRAGGFYLGACYNKPVKLPMTGNCGDEEVETRVNGEAEM